MGKSRDDGFAGELLPGLDVHEQVWLLQDCKRLQDRDILGRRC